MGNHSMQRIPNFLTKNWQPVSNHPNTFRNRLTQEYAHKHIIKVEEPIEIESFKYRMHENNDFLCRVLYYHEYTDSIYHVYADQMHLEPGKRQGDKWALQKVKIMEIFRNLAELFGFTRVCRQMIGADSNGQIKIWIHPNPVSAKAWSPCETEEIMVSDILNVFQSTQQTPYSKNLNKTFDNRNRVYLSFQQYIKEETKKIADSQRSKKSQNNMSTHVKNSTTNFNININIELDGKTKTKTKIKNSPEVDPNKLQTIFNPIVCETKRDEENETLNLDHVYSPKNNRERPHHPNIDYNLHNPAEKLSGNYRTENNTKRRESDFLKSENLQKIVPVKTSGNNYSGVLNLKKMVKQVPTPGKQVKKNILQKYFSKQSSYQTTTKLASKTVTSAHFVNLSTSDSNRPISNIVGITGYRRTPTGKNTSIPDFLAQRAVEVPRIQFKATSLQKYPSTSRRERINTVGSRSIEMNLSPIKNNSNRESDRRRQQDGNKSTMTMIKQQLNSILDAGVETQPQVSKSFEKFKATKAIYKHSYSREEQVEMEQIKEKVEKKKATFADLKLQAMKILEDDF